MASRAGKDQPAAIGDRMTTDAASSADPPAEVMSRPTDARIASRVNTPLLCLIAFAVITFMFSLLNAGAVPQAVLAIIIASGLIFGGTAQLSAALIQIVSGDTSTARSSLRSRANGSCCPRSSSGSPTYACGRTVIPPGPLGTR